MSMKWSPPSKRPLNFILSAAGLAEQAFRWIADSSRDSDKSVLITTISNYNELSEQAFEQALRWPEHVAAQIILSEGTWGDGDPCEEY